MNCRCLLGWILLFLFLQACTSQNSLPLIHPPKEPSEGTKLRLVSQLPQGDHQAFRTSRLLSPSDIIDVQVFQFEDLNRTVEIGYDGLVDLPLIGRIQAAGLTVDALADRIAQSYGRSYLINPQVSVFVKSSVGHQIAIDGEVRKPGLYRANARTSLARLIAEAGGLSSLADPDKIYVFREFKGEKVVARLSLQKVREGLLDDPRLVGGDVVIVFSSSSKVAMANLKDTLRAVGGLRAFGL